MGKMEEEARARLMSLLAEKREIASKFLELTEDQTGIIKRKDEDALNRSLDERQKLIDSFEELRGELEELLEKVAELDSGSDIRSEVLDYESETVKIFGEAAAQSGKNTMAAEKLAVFFSTEAKRIKNEKKGVSTYGRFGGYAVSEHFDEKK